MSHEFPTLIFPIMCEEIARKHFSRTDGQLRVNALGGDPLLRDVLSRVTDAVLYEIADVDGHQTLRPSVVRPLVEVDVMPVDLVVVVVASWTEGRGTHYQQIRRDLFDGFYAWLPEELQLEVHLNIIGLPAVPTPHGMMLGLREPEEDDSLKPPEQARLEHWRGLSGP